MSEWQVGRAVDCFAAPGEATLPVWTARPGSLETVISSLPEAARAFVRASGFEGKAGQMRLLPGLGGLSGALLGLGEERSCWSHAELPFTLPEGTAWRFEAGDYDTERAALGFVLGAYRFTRFVAPKRRPALIEPALATERVRAVGGAIWLARDLVNLPANVLGPAELAREAAEIASRHGVEARLVDGEELERSYPTIAAVGRGAARAPVVAGFDWSGPDAGSEAPHVWLCGKGVCFDSGGYDLKPSAGMLRMKKDMGGAALMLGLADAVMTLGLPLRLSVRIGCVENMVSGAAMRPLDVLRTRRGLTVEVGNTDAEGRLVLCDLLSEASDESPDILIDGATLTGAARVALGPDVPALFSSDDSIARRLQEIGESEGDKLWQLPLVREYDQWLSSSVADLNNVSSKPHAGAIIAALFLKRFVTSGVKWLHLDTFAWNESSRPGRPEGGEAQGLRALLGFLATLNSP